MVQDQTGAHIGKDCLKCAKKKKVHAGCGCFTKATRTQPEIVS